MGLDIYAGTLSRYYARNWKTSVQQWGEANGVQVNMIRPESQNVEIAPPEEIEAGVSSWRDQMVAALGAYITEKPLWNEDVDKTPYYTNKPDWDAVNALVLYVACRASGQPVPETVTKNFDLAKQPGYQAYTGEDRNVFSLIDSDGWWLPIKDSFMFNGYLPTGDKRAFATLGMLKSELEQINALEWRADEETIKRWSYEEGYPTDAYFRQGKVEHVAKNEKYSTVSLAKFAFSILWQAVRHSEEHGTLIIYDF